MKIDMELKPGDVVLLKVLACVLILFFMARFLIFPGIQVRSFDMQSGTYVDSSLQKTEQMNCNCVLAVYTCGELSNTKGE